MRLVFVTSGFSGIHLAYGVMVIGIIFCFVISQKRNAEGCGCVCLSFCPDLQLYKSHCP